MNISLNLYKRSRTSKFFVFYFIFCLLTFLIPKISLAVEPTTGASADVVSLVSTGNTTGDATCSFSQNGGKYCLLAPITGISSDSKTINIVGGGLGEYLGNMYKFGVYIAIGLAVLMIVIGGLQYVSTDAIGDKSDGKKRIQNALAGLVLALMAYIILNTLNPNLLKSDVTLGVDVNLPSNDTGVNLPATSGGSTGLVNVPQTTGNTSSAELNLGADGMAPYTGSTNTSGATNNTTNTNNTIGADGMYDYTGGSTLLLPTNTTGGTGGTKTAVDGNTSFPAVYTTDNNANVNANPILPNLDGTFK